MQHTRSIPNIESFVKPPQTYRHSGLWLTQANEAAEKVRRKSVEKAVARRKSVEKAEAQRIAKEAAEKPNNKYTLNGLLSTIRVPKAHNVSAIPAPHVFLVPL